MEVTAKQSNYYMKIFNKSKMLLALNLLVVIVTSAAGAGIALLLKNIIDIAVAGDMNRFIKALIFNLGYLAVFAVLYYFSSILSKLLLKNVLLNLRKSVFQGIMKRSYKDYNKMNTADYISVLTNDMKMVQENYIDTIMGLVENLFSFLFTLILLLRFHPMIVLILFLGLIVMILIPGLIGQKLQERQDILSNGNSFFTSRLKDIFSGYEVIKSFHLKTRIDQQFTDENSSLATKMYRADKLFVLNETMSQFLAVFTQIITIFAAAYLVIKGSITIGSLVAIMQLAATFVMPLVFIMQNFPKIQSVAPIMKRLQSLEEYEDTSFTDNQIPEFKNQIQINRVSFAYHEEQSVLNDINLTFERGKKYAIVGESGCGKSTLIKLLLGYYEDYTGEILYDDINLKNCDRNKINELASIIHQNVFLFDHTIKDNICLFQNYSEEELERAIKRSGVDKFLPSLQNQLETLAGENGGNLSGGQRQRIAIARALIKGTPILILDEGTSAIDLQTSNDIEKNLLYDSDLTLITITHKLNDQILNLYDYVIYMDQGRVVEMGSYQELFEAKQGFYDFCIA